MKLLILGVGGDWRVCWKIARKTYDEIAYLDGNSSEVIGKLEEFEKYSDYYAAFIAFGNPKIREKWMRKLSGWKRATIISEKAIVSKFATIVKAL